VHLNVDNGAYNSCVYCIWNIVYTYVPTR